MSLKVGMAVIALIAGAGAAPGPELRWRSEYKAARAESAATGKPLLCDFGSEGCVWCQKLDATTFRDPGVTRLLRDRFVCLKVDSEAEPRLVQALRIHGLPTVVVAGPDGTILATHEGYLDAEAMTRFLQEALARLPASAADRNEPPAAGPDTDEQYARRCRVTYRTDPVPGVRPD